ncbi:MAG: lipopolysaccharide heptosyltransferase 1, partial [Piscirickettsiaceae bacterium CG_4_9_14_3_um_filter_43_564]
KFAKAVVSVDTGLSHVAAALDVPMVVIYRVTDPNLVGALGKKVTHLQSPLAHKYIKKFNDKYQQQSSLSSISFRDVLGVLKDKVK